MLKLDPKNTELLNQKQTVLNQSISETENKLKQLRQIKDEADKKMAEGTEINEENYRALQREIINTENKLSNLKNESSNWNKAGENLIKFGENFDKIGSKIDSLGNKLTTRLSLPLTAVATAGVAYNAEIEKYTTAFATFLGDAKEAEKVVSQIKESAAKTPFDVTSLVQANQMLISTGENAQNAQEVILALGDAVTATGGGNAELTRMAANLQQIRNAGKATALDIKQFAYAGIDIYGLLADYTGKTTAEVKDMSVSYDVLSEALKKASKQGGKYYNAMNNASETLTGQVNQLKSEVKDMTGDLTKSLMPVAKKVVGKAKELIQKFDSLSDSQKENIVKIGLMVAAAGPLLKIGGTAITTIGKVSKGFGTLSEAISVMAYKTKSSNESANNLANNLQKLFSVKGITTLAVTTGVALILKSYNDATKETSKLAEETKKAKDKIIEEKNSIDELRTTIDSDAQTELNQIERTQSLWKELQKIADENGKIKKGYENRAKVITGELSEALGTEINITDNVIDKYKELQNEIDTLILKKKGEIILSASEQKYNEAIANREQKTQELIDKEAEYNNTVNERNALYDSLTDKEKEYYKAMSEGRAIYTDLKDIDLTKTTNLQNLDNSIKDTESSINDLKSIINGYTYDMSDYEYNFELFTEGTTESIQKMVDNVGNTYTKNGEIVRTTYLEQIQAQQYYLEYAKKMNADAIANNNETETYKTQTTINEANKRLQALAQELVGMTSATEENSPEIIEAWKQLATQSYSVYYDQVSQLPTELSKKIQEMTGVTLERTPELVEETKNMSTQVLAQIENNEEFKKEAIQNLQGYLNGLQDNELRELLKEAGVENTDKVIKGIREGNLAEDEGKEILKNLNTGLSNSSWQKTLWDKARGIASTLSGLLTVKASVNSSTSNLPGHKNGLDYVPYDDYIARLHKGERVLTAEENKQLMQMEKASKLRVPNMKSIQQSVTDSIKPIFTSPTIVINAQDELTPSKINSIINAVNRRLGSQY